MSNFFLPYHSDQPAVYSRPGLVFKMAGAKKRKQEVVADEQAAAEEQPHDDEDAGSPERKRNAPTQQEDAKETEITEELDSFGRSKDTREAVTVMVTVPTTSTEIIVAKTSFSKKAEPFLSSSTLLLTGHTEAVYSIAFDPTGCYLASGGMDRHIMLWDVKGGNNYNVLEGHKNAILEVKFSGTRIISCSADKSVAVWDANKGCRIRKLTDHSAIVNCCAVAGKNSPNAFASGSDDATVVIWDQRTKVTSLPLKTYTIDDQRTNVCYDLMFSYIYHPHLILFFLVISCLSCLVLSDPDTSYHNLPRLSDHFLVHD